MADFAQIGTWSLRNLVRLLAHNLYSVKWLIVVLRHLTKPADPVPIVKRN